MTTELTTTERPDGLVFYTDGGARPNPGFIGWGFHGYTYKDELPKKGTGNPGYFPSAFGYVQKTSKEGVKEITPLSYIDGFGCTNQKNTNNYAELLAAKAVISKAMEINPKTFLIRTDSEYVRKGVQDWSPIWIRNNWTKQDGTAVGNTSDWKDILANIESLRRMGTEFKIEWVKGHSDVLGNNLADKLATVGVMNSIGGECRTEITTKKPEGYWKLDVDKHPFFSHKRMYFNTLKDSQIKGEYYLGEHGKDDEMLGKRMSDGAYAVIQLQEPEHILELIRSTQTELTGDNDAIVMIRLDEFFRPSTYNYLENYGKNAAVRPSKHRIDLYTLDSEPLTRELRPPRLASRAFDAISTLKSILENYKQKKLENYVVTDITDQFYKKEVTIKKKVEVVEMKLNSNINSTFVSLPIIVDIDNKPIKFILTPGIDLPRRNNLKALESPDIKILVLIYKESDVAYRHVTIIENGKDFGIWAGIYSNIVFNNK